jgi:hypothetical protein
LREEQETNTTTFAVSSLPTTSNGFEAFSFLIKDCATGAASSNPVTNMANLSDLSCELAGTTSTRSANNTNVIGFFISSFTHHSLLTCGYCGFVLSIQVIVRESLLDIVQDILANNGEADFAVSSRGLALGESIVSEREKQGE